MVIAMELTAKELAYLELYKGLDEGIKVLHPEAPEGYEWIYTMQYNYETINTFLTFIATKDIRLLKKVRIKNLDNILDMIITLSDVACRYAFENPLYYQNLYRYENRKNLENYELDGLTLSFKSTSKSESEASVFDYPNTKGLKFRAFGFIPYIDVDKIVKTNLFSDEKEILFPPFVGAFLSSETERDYRGEYPVVQLFDSFDDGDQYSTEAYKTAFNTVKDSFIEELKECKEKSEVSSELSTYCQLLFSYLYNTTRVNYKKYADMYNLQNGEDLKK